MEAASGRLARWCAAGADPEPSSRDVLVGAAGIEPATTCSQSRYATAALRPEGVRLSHVAHDGGFEPEDALGAYVRFGGNP